MKKILFLLLTISFIAFGSTTFNQSEKNIKHFDNDGISFVSSIAGFDDDDLPEATTL